MAEPLRACPHLRGHSEPVSNAAAKTARPRSLSIGSFRNSRTAQMQNSPPTCAPSASQHSPSSPTSSSTGRRLSISSLSSRLSGISPSSFIEPEARSSNTLSTSSREDPTIFSSQPLSQQRPETRESLLTLGRISIVSNSRPSISRRPTSTSAREEFGQSNSPWSHKSALKRMSWGWNQTFAGLTPQQLTEVEYQRGRASEVRIPRRSASESRPSTAVSQTSTTSAQSDASTIISTGSSINKPFANRRTSVVRPTEPTLPPVAEETQNEEAIEEEVDEMGLGRAITKRFPRMSMSNTTVEEKKRPVIGLPSLISTTNAQLTEAYEVHPALRNSTSSNGYSNSTSPTTPICETPGLTDTSSIGSSRSSRAESPLEGRYESGPPAISPNHLTQYFPQPSPDKVCENVVVVSNNVNDDDVVASTPAPALPARAPSHSKREHERLAKSRSMRSSTGSGYSSRHTSTSTNQANGFAKELAQVEEVQEEVNNTGAVPVTEAKGLRTFTPSVYMLDLADLEATRWIDETGRTSVAA